MFFSRHFLSAGLVITGTMAGVAQAQNPVSTVATGVTAGSTAFCLFEVPSDESARHRWINLGIVQYVETTPNELKIAYGGGSFGSGFEVKISLSKPEEAQTLLEKMRKTAAACR